MLTKSVWESVVEQHREIGVFHPRGDVADSSFDRRTREFTVGRGGPDVRHIGRARLIPVPQKHQYHHTVSCGLLQYCVGRLMTRRMDEDLPTAAR